MEHIAFLVASPSTSDVSHTPNATTARNMWELWKWRIVPAQGKILNGTFCYIAAHLPHFFLILRLATIRAMVVLICRHFHAFFSYLMKKRIVKHNLSWNLIRGRSNTLLHLFWEFFTPSQSPSSIPVLLLSYIWTPCVILNLLLMNVMRAIDVK